MLAERNLFGYLVFDNDDRRSWIKKFNPDYPGGLLFSDSKHFVTYRKCFSLFVGLQKPKIAHVY